MTFDNSKTIIGFRIKIFILTVIFLAYLILAYFAELIPFPLLGLDDAYWTLMLSVIWVTAALLPMILNFQFVFFSDDTENIVFRYFNAGIFGGKKNAVEIDKRLFAGYTTEKKMFGQMISITLYQKFNDGVAKYPPIYISALSKQEKMRLFKILNTYSAS
ncbi:MAG TPA: hypothetical protein VHO50_01490 [Bacteroidales bacterium]|nr:hypothetical protein [Bacteroidales bacterium]